MEGSDKLTARVVFQNDSNEENVKTEEEEPYQQRNETLFTELKPYCLELIQLLQNPNKHASPSPSLLPSLFRLLESTPPPPLLPFFDYVLFPLMLLLDAAVAERGKKDDGAAAVGDTGPSIARRVSDKVAEDLLPCLEELLYKCHLASVDQMVVLMRKLTDAAMLSPSKASEEFRLGVIKCFRALIFSLLLCSNETCSCRQVPVMPALLEIRDMLPPSYLSGRYIVQQGECLIAFLQSQAAAPAVGHWLSLLLKAADAEAVRGHRGSGRLRSEAFFTLRVLVAKVGTADALAFFLPGVVSQFAKALNVSKTMISGAAGSVAAIDQAVRGLAEFLMIVLDDNANSSCLDVSFDVVGGFTSSESDSASSFLDELRQLPINIQGQSKPTNEEVIGETLKSTSKSDAQPKFGKEMGSLHVDRTRDWIQKTSGHVNKLLNATFPYICLHQAKRVRQGIAAALCGLLSKCSYALSETRLMLLECLCLLIVDDCEEVSLPAQEFLESVYSLGNNHHFKRDVAEMFHRLIEKLPKVVLGNDDTVALVHAQQLLVIIYYSGPEFVLNYLQSPVTAARFLEVFAICLSQTSAFTGSLDKLAKRSLVGYLHSITELKAGSNFSNEIQMVTNSFPSDISKFKGNLGKGMQYQVETVPDSHELPRMPPWFTAVGSVKLYRALSGTLRLVGLSLMADFRDEGLASIVTDIPLGCLRKLVSDVRVKEYTNVSWQSWYNRTGAGQSLRQASTAACLLNEMVYGVSARAVDDLTKMLQKSGSSSEDRKELDAPFTGCWSYTTQNPKFAWKAVQEKAAKSQLIDCTGRILHEYLSSEIWDLPVDCKYSHIQSAGEVDEITSYFFHETSMLHQVLIDGIGIFAVCLGKDFASSGFLQSSLYLLLESLICSNFLVRSAADATLHVLSATSGHAMVGQLVLANADYVIDSICRQLRHLDLNPHVPNVLASMLSYIGVAHKILPLLEEPMRCTSQELEILGRHQHPELTIPFLKAVAEIIKASKREAFSLPITAESYLKHVKTNISHLEKEGRTVCIEEKASEEWENVVFKLTDSKRFRRTVGSIAGSCLVAATPLLASVQQEICLVALDVVEDSFATLAKVEEAYQYERQTREVIEEMVQSYLLYQLKDSMDAAEDSGADENRLLPAANKVWPFLVACVRNRNPVAVKRCLSVVVNIVQVCGGDFFTRRFHTDGPHFWKLLSTSPYQAKPFSKEDRLPLRLPYRTSQTSLENPVAELSNLKVQVALLNAIANLSRSKSSSSALDLVIKKVSGLVVAIACSGVLGLRDAAINALHGLATIDADLVWLLLADVYYSLKKKDLPSPPVLGLPDVSEILPPPVSAKDFLYVQYAGQTFGFDINFSSVETVFKKLQSLVFTDQIYL